MSRCKSIDLSGELTGVINEICRFSPSFGHIDHERIAVCIASNRSGGRGATYGKLVPMRFRQGSQVVRHSGRHYSMPEILKGELPLLYLIYFYMPRFFDLPAREKIRVIFHELYHISPDFDGDIRRMGRVKVAHGHSRKSFDSSFSGEMEDFLGHISAGPLMDFLDMTSSHIYSGYERIVGLRMKTPRPVPVD